MPLIFFIVWKNEKNLSNKVKYEMLTRLWRDRYDSTGKSHFYSQPFNIMYMKTLGRRDLEVESWNANGHKSLKVRKWLPYVHIQHIQNRFLKSVGSIM